MASDERVVVQDFAGSFMSNDQFAPVDQQGIVPAAQGNLVDKAIAPDFPVFAVPMTLRKSFHAAVLVKNSDPLV